jgi:uncharacterized protein YndB with AHSA1/START domain
VSTLGSIDGDRVRFERMLEAPPESVWDFLTNSELLSEWLGAGEIEPKVGGKVFLRPGGPVIRGVVKECEAPTLLSYTWNVYMIGSDDLITPESLLRFELVGKDGGTALTLTQGPIIPPMLSTTAAGWHTILDILAAHLAEETPPDFMDVFQSVVAEYEKAASTA